jgi:hypothetical protein
VSASCLCYVPCLYVLLICLAYMYASVCKLSLLYVSVICLAYMSCLYVLLICRAYMSCLYGSDSSAEVCKLSLYAREDSRGELIHLVLKGRYLLVVRR